MMGHPLERLSAYLDGELQSDERAQLERHLQGCTVCQEALDGYRRVDQHFGGLLERIPVPDAGRIRVGPAKSQAIFAKLALAAGVVVAMGFMVPSVRAHVAGWLFASRSDDAAARAAFAVYRPGWLPSGAAQLPALLSEPDEHGKFMCVELVWTGAADSRESVLILTQQLRSSQRVKDLVPDGQPVKIGNQPALMVERTWHEGEVAKREVRVAWTLDGITFFLQSGVLSPDEMLRVAQELRPTSPVVAQENVEPAQPGTGYDAGPVDRFTISSVTHFPEQHVFLVRLSDEFIAFYDRDPHLRHLVTWDAVERNFVSPADGESFTMDGTPIAGPTPRGLDRYRVTIVNGRVTIDLGSLSPGSAHAGSGNSTVPPGRP